MKNILLSLSLVFIVSYTLFSQTVITFNNHAPQAGDQNNYTEISFFDPGQGGKDLVWDFSQVLPLEKKVVSQMNRPDSKQSDMFLLTPNLVLNEDDKFHFMNITQDVYELVGVKAEKYDLVYEQPVKRLVFPMTYNDFYSGAVNGTATYNTNYTIELTGSYTIEADAYGLLLLPNNVFKNVIRVRQTTKTTQVSMCSVVEVLNNKYTWYSYDERYPLMSVIITEQKFSDGNNKLIQEAFMSEKFITNSEVFVAESASDNMFTYNVFPNPFKNDINITYQLNRDFDVTVGIYDIVGKRVKDIVLNENQKEGIYTYTVGASDIGLNPGMYFIKFEFGDKVLIEKIIRSR